MSFTITLGWWLLPLLITAGSFTGALWDRPSEHGGFIPHPGPLIRFVGAIILSLVTWLVYVLILLVLK